MDVTFLEMQNDILSDLPGLPRSMVKTFLNRAQVDLSRMWPWIALEKSFTLGTESVESDGTVSVSVGSKSVSGSGTSFSSSHVGWRIRLGGSYQTYEVVSASSTTSLTIDREYVGSEDLSGGTYELFKLRYSLDTSLKELYSVVYNTPLTERSLEELDRTDPHRVSVGTPTHYCVEGKDEDGALQIELWPRPTSPILLSYSGLLKITTMRVDGESPLLDGDVIVKLARVMLAPKAMRIRKDDASLIQASLPLWKEEFEVAYSDLLREDNRVRSERESVQDALSPRIVGEPFWVDRDSEL